MNNYHLLKIWLGIEAKRFFSNLASFGFESIVIIILFVLLLLFVLPKFVQKYKDSNFNVKTDFILIILLFIIMFIPMAHISKARLTPIEKRSLAKYRPLIVLKKDKKIKYKKGKIPKYNVKINLKYGKDFDKWFNDRFFQRQNLIYLHNIIYFNLTDRTNKGFIDKKSLFVYERSDFLHTRPSKMKKSFEALEKFNEFCKNNNIKLYVIIAPKKADIYRLSNSYIDDSKDHKNFIKFLEQWNKKNTIKLIYPYSELLDGKKKNFVYFKTDTHWTDDGAYIGYKALMNILIKDFPNVSVLKNEDFNYKFNDKVRSEYDRDFEWGGSMNHVGVPEFMFKRFHDVKYRYYTHKNKDKLIEVHFYDKSVKNKLYKYPYGANYKVILLGTSFSENLTEFLPYTFKEVFRIRNNNVRGKGSKDDFKIMKYYKGVIKKYKPDILIFCVSYGNIKQLKYMFDD